MQKSISKKIAPYVLIIPALLVYTLIMFIPMLQNIKLSFTDWDGFGETFNYVGLINYINVLQDDKVFTAFKVTFEMSIFIIILQQTLGIILALILEKNTRANVFFRSLFFIPNLLTSVVVGIIFSYALSLNFGILSTFFNAIGLPQIAAIDWLGDEKYAIWAIVFTNVWQYAGYSMVLYIAALKGIPNELFESSQIDGASPWQRFKNITFPMISPAITLNCLITLIGCIKLFDLPYVLTRGGPGNATQTIALLLYRDSFVENNAGKGAAEAAILVIVILILSVLQTSYLKKREVNL